MTKPANELKQEFIDKVKQLDMDGLRTLFDKLKADGAPLGMLLFISDEYATRK